ncbi:MAG: hypothetical protein ABSB83_05805 [Methanomassiliicoccales archaeon]
MQEEYKENRVSVIAIVVGIAMVLSLFMLSLPAVDVLITDAGIRWAFFLIVCVLLALFLLRTAYPRSAHRVDRPEIGPEEESVGPIRKMVTTIGKGTGGDSMSQMVAYSELKKAAIRRVRVRRRIPQDDMESLLRDNDKLAEVVRDDDLVELITTDLNRTFLNPYSPSNSKWRSSFDVRFNSLLDKLEGWQ